MKIVIVKKFPTPAPENDNDYTRAHFFGKKHGVVNDLNQENPLGDNCEDACPEKECVDVYSCSTGVLVGTFEKNVAIQPGVYTAPTGADRKIRCVRVENSVKTMCGPSAFAGFELIDDQVNGCESDVCDPPKTETPKVCTDQGADGLPACNYGAVIDARKDDSFITAENPEGYMFWDKLVKYTAWNGGPLKPITTCIYWDRCGRCLPSDHEHYARQCCLDQCDECWSDLQNSILTLKILNFKGQQMDFIMQGGQVELVKVALLELMNFGVKMMLLMTDSRGLSLLWTNFWLLRPLAQLVEEFGSEPCNSSPSILKAQDTDTIEVKNNVDDDGVRGKRLNVENVNRPADLCGGDALNIDECCVRDCNGI